MQLTRWTPRQRVGYRGSLFPGIIDDFFSPLTVNHSSTAREYMPSVDIYEKDNVVFFEAEVPGFNKDDLKIDVAGKVITISGEKKEEKKEEGENHFRKERRFGRFERSFQLGFEAESDSVKAKYDNGVLTIEVPKPEDKQIKSIQIH